MKNTSQNKHCPCIYAIAGIPTAGKTSFRADAINKGILPASAFVHDCDDVMASLPGYQEQLAAEGPAAAFKNWELPARAIAEETLHAQIAAQKDIIYDRSCALLSSYEFIKDLVTQHGYKLIMHVLMVDETEAKKRASQREAQIGRHTPDEVIDERLQMISNLWPRYLELATEAYLLDNKDFQHRLVAIYKDNKLLINDDNAYNNFISVKNS